VPARVMMGLMAGARPEEHVSRPVVYQDWRDLTFMHWRVDPDVVARFLPPPLQPHLFDGSAWVSLTPFRVERFRLPVLPPLPLLSSFPETNLRTYAVDPDGVDGIWFLSLEADSLPTVAAGRVVGVAYQWASMRVERRGDLVHYSSRRRTAPHAMHEITVRVGEPLAEEELTELDHWLTGRWRSWARPFGGLAHVPVEHEPWPLRRGEVVELDETLFESAGLVRPDEPPLVRFSEGVHARLGAPRRSSAVEVRPGR
jgi:uncharacterized protein YqjF (DUF2071 family)